MKTWKIKYVRLERPKTNSWITYKLPKTMCFDEKLDCFLESVMPGWEVVSGSYDDPDEE